MQWTGYQPVDCGWMLSDVCRMSSSDRIDEAVEMSEYSVQTKEVVLENTWLVRGWMCKVLVLPQIVISLVRYKKRERVIDKCMHRKRAFVVAQKLLHFVINLWLSAVWLNFNKSDCEWIAPKVCCYSWQWSNCLFFCRVLGYVENTRLLLGGKLESQLWTCFKHLTWWGKNRDFSLSIS